MGQSRDLRRGGDHISAAFASRPVQTISTRTRLGSAFGGLVLLAIATSLPEIATTVTGGVLGNAELLTNNLLGGIAMQTAVLAIADVALRRGALTHFAPKLTLLLRGVSLIGDIFFPAGPLLEAAPRQAMFTCALGLVMTTIYLWGLLERKDRTIWRFGIDSVLVLGLYFAGLVVLYRMR